MLFIIFAAVHEFTNYYPIIISFATLPSPLLLRQESAET